MTRIAPRTNRRLNTSLTVGAILVELARGVAAEIKIAETDRGIHRAWVAEALGGAAACAWLATGV